MKACSQFPMVKATVNTRHTLYLIREELKSRKLFYVLGKVGLDDCFFQVHLDFIILDYIGMNDGTDETYAMYDAIVERHARRIQDSKQSIERHANKVLNELVTEAERRTAEKKATPHKRTAR